MGRPPRLNPELQKRIVTAIAGGNTLEASAWSAGVTPSQVLGWVRRGEGRDKKHKKTKLYSQFAQALKKARADGQVERILRIRKAGVGGAVIERRTVTRGKGENATTEVIEKFSQPQWQADAWQLERSDPDHWALRDRKELVELRKQVAELEKRLGQSQEPPAAA